MLNPVESDFSGFGFTLPSEHIQNPLMFTLVPVRYQQKRPTRSQQLVGIHLTRVLMSRVVLSILIDCVPPLITQR